MFTSVPILTLLQASLHGRGGQKKCIMFVHMERQTQSDANLRIQTVFRCLILISVVSPLARPAIFTKPLNTLKHCFILLGFVDMLLHSTPLIYYIVFASYYTLQLTLAIWNMFIRLNCIVGFAVCTVHPVYSNFSYNFAPHLPRFLRPLRPLRPRPGSIQGAGGRASCQVGTPKRSWNPRWSMQLRAAHVFQGGVLPCFDWGWHHWERRLAGLMAPVWWAWLRKEPTRDM